MADETAAPKAADAKAYRIWDVPTRLFHWLLVISIVASWVTADVVDDQMQLHLWLGYWTLGLIAFRMLWGLFGSRHARFASFLKGPMKVLAYGRSLAGKHHVEAAGHNPMGGWMVFLMIALVAVQTVSGLFTDDDIIWAGPWTPAVSGSMVNLATRIHHINFNLIQAAVAAHLVAVLAYQFGLRNDLVGAMITGRKSSSRIDASHAIPGTPWGRAALAALLAGGLVYAVLAFAPAPVDDFGY
jgi:cytochrome b